MKHLYVSKSLSLLAVIVILAGCVPSAPPAAPQAETSPPDEKLPPDSELAMLEDLSPLSGNSPTAAPPPAAAAAAQEHGREVLDFGPTGSPNAFVKVIRRQDGSGYDVEGSFDLKGAIQWQPEKKEWLLEGDFYFTNPKTKIGEFTTIDLGMIQSPAQDPEAEKKMTEFYMIEIEVNQAPEEDTQGKSKRPYHFRFPFKAPETAHFTISLVQEYAK